MSTDGPPGTGGLFLEPPGGDDGPREDIGFAPDLGEPVGGDPDAEDTASIPVAPAPGPDRGPASSRTASTRAPRTRAAVGYPLAEAALARLLGEGPADPAQAAPPAPLDEMPAIDPLLGVDAGAALPPFGVGPAITHRPPEVRRPPPPRPEPEPDEIEPLTEDMLDMVLIGGEDDGPPTVHLMFKAGVLGGAHLLLERRPEGLYARFQVEDAHSRRTIEGQIDALLARLRDRGIRVAGHEVVVEARER